MGNLKKSIQHTKLLLCGESHGVRENADVLFTLCVELGIKKVAIERSRSAYKPFVDSALDEHPNFLLPGALLSLQASVLSLEVLKTLCRLVQDRKILHIDYVDLDDSQASPTSETPEEYMKRRERGIARNILKLDDSEATLVLLGKYHTRLKTDEFVGASSLQLVRNERPVTLLKYHYVYGSQYNAGRLMDFPDTRPDDAFKNPSYKIIEKAEDTFTLTIPHAHHINV